MAANMGHFMSKAVKNPGGLHKALHIPMGQTIPPAKIQSAKKQGGKVAKMANLADVFARFRPH